MKNFDGNVCFAERVPERLQHVPDFIDKLVQFCVDHSPYPNRILALCGVIALLSFLTVRKVMFKSGARPNLYIIAVATSGTGKDYAQNKKYYPQTRRNNFKKRPCPRTP